MLWEKILKVNIMIFSIDKWENNINRGDEVLVKSEQDVEKSLAF